jgi:preprotein translocase subunit Sec61beta
MSVRRKQSRRKRRRSGSSPMPAGGAGLMRFFEDSSIGVKIGPISTILLSALLIGIVILAHLGILNWLFTPGSTAGG